MMKITSSTSITSISGTMLISDIGAPPLRESKLAKAIAQLLQAAAGRAPSACTLAAGAVAAPWPSAWPIETKVCSS